MNRAPVAADFSFPSSEKGFHTLCSALWFVWKTVAGGLARALTQTPTISRSAVAWSRCQALRGCYPRFVWGTEGSMAARVLVMMTAPLQINWSIIATQVWKTKKKSLLIYIWRKRSASWTLTAAADYSHRRTDTSSGCALNLSKCKLVVLRHKSPHCPSFER